MISIINKGLSSVLHLPYKRIQTNTNMDKKEVKVQVRMGAGLYKKLQKAAQENERSVSGQVRYSINKSLMESNK